MDFRFIFSSFLAKMEPGRRHRRVTDVFFEKARTPSSSLPRNIAHSYVRIRARILRRAEVGPFEPFRQERQPQVHDAPTKTSKPSTHHITTAAVL